MYIMITIIFKHVNKLGEGGKKERRLRVWIPIYPSRLITIVNVIIQNIYQYQNIIPDLAGIFQRKENGRISLGMTVLDKTKSHIFCLYHNEKVLLTL